MDFDDIERILELVTQHDLAEFELERDGLKLRIRKSGTLAPPGPAPAPVPPSAQSGAPLPPAAAITSDAGPLPVDLVVVKSPIVGTFYRSPDPAAAAFVEVGARVKKDQVLCIIEAMKLMNEITSEYEGEVVSAYVENGKPVQYGERLFAIRVA